MVPGCGTTAQSGDFGSNAENTFRLLRDVTLTGTFNMNFCAMFAVSTSAHAHVSR